MNLATINNPTTIRTDSNEEQWQLPKRGKICKDRDPINAEIRRTLTNKIETSAQPKFCKINVQNDLNSGKNLKELNWVPKKNPEFEAKVERLAQDKLNVSDECNVLKNSPKEKSQKLKQSQKIEVELSKKIQQLESDVTSISLKFHKASEDVQVQTQNFNEISLKMESLENLLKERSDKITSSDLKEQEYNHLRQELEGQILSLKEEYEVIQEELQVLETVYNISLQKEIDRNDMNGALLQKTREINETNVREMEALSRKLVGARSKIEERESCIEKLNSEIELKNQQCESLEIKVKNQNEELKINELKEEKHTKQTYDLISEKWTVSQQLKISLNKIEEMKSSIEDMKLALVNKKTFCEKLQLLLTAKKTELEQKISENEQLISENMQISEEYELSCKLAKDIREIQDSKIQDLVNQNQIIQSELNEVTENFKAKENDLKTIHDKKVEDMSKVCKPTSVELKSSLKKIEAIVIDLAKFLSSNEEIKGKFIINLNKLKENQAQTPSVLQLHLDDADAKYVDLIQSYVDISKQFASEKDEITASTTEVVSIPEALFNSISARFSIPLDDIKSENKLFDDTKKSCNEAFANLNKLFEDSKASAEALKKELNALDVEITKMENPLGWTEWATKGYVAKKIRFSPLDIAFSGIAIK